MKKSPKQEQQWSQQSLGCACQRKLSPNGVRVNVARHAGDLIEEDVGSARQLDQRARSLTAGWRQERRFYDISMIWESWYWRSDLKKFAESLRKREKQKRWPDPSLARCEQTIMVGFFYVRKLIESRKLSRDFADLQVKATVYPTKGKHVHLLNRRRDLDELFDLDAPKQTRMKIEDLANQLIHSYIFYIAKEKGGQLTGILVASDRIRNKELLQISSLEVIKIFELAAKGERDKAISWDYDDKVQDYIVRLAKPQKRPK